MTEYFDILGDQSLIVDEVGDIVESHGPDRMSLLAHRRHDAYQQKKGWEVTLAILDRALLANHAGGAYGPIVIKEARSSYTKLDVDRFLSTLPEMNMAESLEVLASVTGFDRKKLPPITHEAFDAATERVQKRPWIESVIATRPAPGVMRIEREEE